METKVDRFYDHIKRYWIHILQENETHLICEMLSMRRNHPHRPTDTHTHTHCFSETLKFALLKHHNLSVLYFFTHNCLGLSNILLLFQSAVVFLLIQNRKWFSCEQQFTGN